MLALATAAPGCSSYTEDLVTLEMNGSMDGMEGTDSRPGMSKDAAARGVEASSRTAPIAGDGAAGSAPSRDDSAPGSNAAVPASDPMTDPAAPGNAPPDPAPSPAAAPAAGAPAAGSDAAMMAGASGANDPAPTTMDAGPAPDDSVSQCRRDFEQCWGTKGDIPGCAAEANQCGLFPDGPASAMACYTTMTSCFVSTFFDYPECIGRAEACGLLRPGAQACAVILASCMIGGPISQCFMDAAECGLFPVAGATATASPMAFPGVPGT